MVFSSASSFIDPPNWPLQISANHHHHHHRPDHFQQQPSQQSGSIINPHEVSSHQLPLLPRNPNPNSAAGDPSRLGGGSMSERARLERLPPPEGPQKCPRCDSTNTKFCYYNNYSLAQPRHFCKACRRYWTRGGALRNVPVGGGFRRNKKGKSGNTSKSSPSSSNQNNTQTVTATPSPQFTQMYNNQFPFMPTLHNLSQLGNSGLNLSGINGDGQAHQISLSPTSGISNNNTSSFMSSLGFRYSGARENSSDLMINNNNNNENSILTSTNHFALFDPATGLYTFQNEGNMGNNSGLSSSSAPMLDARVSQTTMVKMEENRLANISRPTQYWTGSGILGSSSKDHLM